MIEFSIIHPSRQRPAKSFATLSTWLMKSCVKNSIEYIISIDVDDPTLSDYERLYSGFPGVLLKADNKNAVQAINRAASISKGRIMMVVSDDTACFTCWDLKIMKYTNGLNDFVMKTKDGIQPVIITAPILDRVYYQRDGYIYHPAFSHCWADRYFTEIAHKRKRVITKNMMFRHMHYSVLKKKPDDQYKRTDATFNEGKRIYKQLMAEV